MGIEASNGTSHSGTDEVFVKVGTDHRIHCGLECGYNNLLWDNCFNDNALAAAFQPVGRSSLLVGAHVAAQSNQLEGWKLLAQEVDNSKRSL